MLALLPILAAMGAAMAAQPAVDTPPESAPVPASALARAAPKPSHLRLWIVPGVVGAIGPEKANSVGGGVMGGLGLSLGPHPERAVGFEAKIRELYVTEDLRNLGNVSVCFRYPAGNGAHIGLGFAHNHEIGWEDYKADIGGSIAGVSANINHRTGFEILAGYDFGPTAPADAEIGNRFRMSAQVSAVVLPGTAGPVVYMMLETGVRFGITKPATAL